MPPLGRLKLGVLQDLAAQMRFAPQDAVRRAIERAEELAGEVEAGNTYPNEWVVYRVTRYRPESGGLMSTEGVVGEALLRELGTFVEHLCDACRVSEKELEGTEGEFVDAGTLAARWGVSRKTLDRYRGTGLVARRVRGAKGKVKILFSARAAEAFRSRHGERISEAGRYTRMDEATRNRIVRVAARMQKMHGCSLNQVAARLADKHGRSHEAIRQLLFKHAGERDGTKKKRTPAAGGQGGAGGAGAELDAGTSPISERKRRVAYRAWKRAIEPGAIAEHLGHSKASVQRAILLERVALLESQIPAMSGHEALTFEMQGADEVLLGPAPVWKWERRRVERDLAEFLEQNRARVVPVGAEESARAIAYWYLLWKSRVAIARVSRLHPSAGEIDAVETWLKWAARLKALLVRSQFPLMIETLEKRLEARLETLRPGLAVEMVREGIGAVRDAVDAFDPLRAAGSGARLAGAVSPAITRLAARWARRVQEEAPRGRATALYTQSPVLEDWTRALCPWQRFVEQAWRVRVGSEAKGGANGAFLAEREGWGEEAPKTQKRMADERSTTVTKIARDERNAVRAALEAWRKGQEKRRG